jgi:phage head maturation protease
MDTSKAALLSGNSGIQLFCPIAKIEKQPDGTLWAMGWGSVSDYRDDQNEIVDPAAMREAVAEWAPWGNIRLQHDAARPIGVCPEGNWEIKAHPETGTDALWLNAHIVEPTAIRMLEEGVLKGFSIGGVCLERKAEKIVGQDGSEERTYRLKRFKLSEISLVDKPACDLATVERIEIAKRADDIALPQLVGAAAEPLQLGAEEVGTLRKFFGRLFGRQVLTTENATDAGANRREIEGRPAAAGRGERRPAEKGGKAIGRPLAKSLGAIAFLAQKLAAWDADIEAMNLVASALNLEAIEEEDGSAASKRMLNEITEFRRVRERFGHLMAEIAEEEAGEIAEGTEEGDDIVMNAAKLLKAINEAAREGEVRKTGRAISAANAAHLAKCGAHLDKAVEHHEQLGTQLAELNKCYKAAGAGIDEAEEHLAQAQEAHEAIGEHHELAKLHLRKVGAPEGTESDPMDDEPQGAIEDLSIEDIIASALGSGGRRKRGVSGVVSELISLIRKNAELEARLAVLDNTPARPKARLYAVHKGDEARALIEDPDIRGSDSHPSYAPNDRDAFRKSYRSTFANPRSVRDPMFKGSAGGSL